MRFLIAIIFGISLVISVSAQKNASIKPLAPSFIVTSIDGKNFDSENLRDKVVVVNLWFINCPNCVEEIKLLNNLVDEYKGKNVVFIGMATNKKADLEKFLKKNPFHYNIVPSAMQTILSFGEPDKNGEINIPFPMHIVIDRAGRIVVRKSGIKGLDEVKNELQRQFNTVSNKQN